MRFLSCFANSDKYKAHFLLLASFPWPSWLRVSAVVVTVIIRRGERGVKLFTRQFKCVPCCAPPLTTLKWCCNKHYANIANIMYTFQSTLRLSWSIQCSNIFLVSTFLPFHWTFCLGRCGTRESNEGNFLAKCWCQQFVCHCSLQLGEKWKCHQQNDKL